MDDKSPIVAEISAQRDMLKYIDLDKNDIMKIDRHIKDTEVWLNERLLFLPTAVVIQNYVPKVKDGQYFTKLTDELWGQFSFNQVRPNHEKYHEELSFLRYSKGFGFFYKCGVVVFDTAVNEPVCDIFDCYYRVVEDRRKTYKLTGAPAEIKIKAFPHLKKLLFELVTATGKITKYRHSHFVELQGATEPENISIQIEENCEPDSSELSGADE